jgi:tripartite-type tricarboxylate transporter receptor subunit TctC
VRKLAFDPLKDLEGVSLVSSVPLVLVVHPSLRVRNVRDLAALSKKSKTDLNAGGR